MVEESKIGMMFDSEEEVLSYYKQYAKQVGFGVTKRSSTIGDDVKLKNTSPMYVFVKAHQKANHLILLGQNQWREWGVRRRSMQN
jgi:hypothetical protein